LKNDSLNNKIVYMPEGNAGGCCTLKRTIIAGVWLVAMLGVTGCTVGGQEKPSADVTSSTPPSSPECTGAISGIERQDVAEGGYRYLVKDVALDNCVSLLSSRGEEIIGKIVAGDFVVAVCDTKGGGAITGLVSVNHEPVDDPSGARDIQEGNTSVGLPALAQMIDDDGLKPCG
jgi:hypothetical protein